MNEQTKNKETDIREEYISLKKSVLELETLTLNSQFRRIWNYLRDIEAKCYRPACEVDKKELDYIHHIHSTIKNIFIEISKPVLNLHLFITTHKGTLFEPVLESLIKDTYAWDDQNGFVIVNGIDLEKPTIDSMAKKMLTNN